MKSKLFTIDDLLLGETRAVRICLGELVLTPDYTKGFRTNPSSIAFLGVVKEFGKYEQPSLILDPLYKISASSDDLSELRVERWKGGNSWYTNFLKTIFTGTTDAISQALIDGPFSNMEQLADAIKKLQLPYDETLERFLETSRFTLMQSPYFSSRVSSVNLDGDQELEHAPDFSPRVLNKKTTELSKTGSYG